MRKASGRRIWTNPPAIQMLVPGFSVRELPLELNNINNLELKDGSAANGVILENTADKVVLGQVTGQALAIPKNQISTMKASSVSLMPEGLLKGLTFQQQNDLLTFLLSAESK